MKRILSFVLSLVFVIGMLPCFGVSAATSDDMTATDRVIQQMRDLGIMEGDENGDIEPTATLSRAEFVTLIARIMDMEDIYADAENDLFVDVSQNYWAKSAILACAKAGYINGTEPGVFSPEDNISLEQALKIMVRVLGYEYMAQEKGGYPAGYLYTANRLELMDNITTAQTDPVTKGDAAHLFFNSLEVTLTEEVGYSGDSVLMTNLGNRTILGEYMGLARAEATLDAIYGASVIDEEVDSQSQIIVGGTLYEFEGKDLRDLLGRTVDYFYTIGEKQLKSTVKSVLPAENMNHEVTVNLADLSTAAGDEITYTDDNENEQKLNVATTTKYVKNYELLLDYDIANLKTIQNGKVVFVDNDDDRAYDFAFIYDYTTFVVDSKTVNMIQGKNNDTYIDLTDEDKLLYLNYYDGREVALSKIKPGHVLFVIDTPEILEIYVNDKMITGTYEAQGNNTVTIGGTKYDAAKDLYAPGVKLGDTVNVYFNPYQEVAYMDGITTADAATGYLYRLAETESTFSGGLSVKIFTEDGDLISLALADRITMNDNFYNVQKDASLIKANLDYTTENNIRPQLVKYQLNEDGKICILNTAATYLNADEDGFMVFFGADSRDESGKWTQGTTFSGNSTYESSQFYNADGTLILSASTTATKVFTVPKWAAIGSADEKDFRLSTSSGLGYKESNQTITIYTNSKAATVADYVVVHSDNPSLDTGEVADYELVIYIASTTVWEDGEAKDAIEYYGKNGYTTVKLPDYLTTTPAISELHKGDAIRVSTDWNGDLDHLTRVYDRVNETATRKNSTYYYDVNAAYVVYENDGMLRVNATKNPVKDSTMFTSSLLLSADATNVYVVDTRNGKLTVSKGSASDIVVGDRVVYHRRRGVTTALVVYKEN